MADIPLPTGESKVVYQGQIIEVVSQIFKVGKGSKVFESARRSPGTRSIILSPDRSKILITREYRSELRGYDFRLPGGKIFETLEEYNRFLASKSDLASKAREGAKREILEETGLQAVEIEFFQTASSGSWTIDWDLFYFVVTKTKQAERGQHLDPGEDIEIQWKNIDDVKKLCLEGKMQEKRSAAVFLEFLHTKLNKI